MKQQQEDRRLMYSLVADLKACSIRKDIQLGKRLHAKAVESGSASNNYVATALIKMYAKCGSTFHARQVFDGIHKPEVVSWTALLLGYADNGEEQLAVELFFKMKAEGCAPNCVTYVAVLKACTRLAASGSCNRKAHCLELGRNIHWEIGHHMDLHLQCTLIDMYAKSGSMTDARAVFNSIQEPDVVSWNALLMGYAETGQGHVALDLFSRMNDCVPDSVTYVAVFKACTALGRNGDDSGKAHGLEMGRRIHSEIGSSLNLYVLNTLIDMYANCGSMGEARQVFDSIQNRSLVSWNVVISGYAENGEGHAALDMFSRMKATQKYVPDSITYIAAVKACTSLAVHGHKVQALRLGRDLHSEIGSCSNLQLQSTLVDMYAKCSNMFDAQRVFDSIQKPNVVSWTALLLGYAENGEGHVALELFSKMKARRCAPNSVTYIAVLKACSSLAVNGGVQGKARCLEVGRNIHLEAGCHLDIYVQNVLIDMYAKCGSMVDAQQVFDSIQKPGVVFWNALILGYVDNGQGQTALDLFYKMKTLECAPTSVTYVAVLKACASLAMHGGDSGKMLVLKAGRSIHMEVGLLMDVYVQSTLIDMYAKCGSMAEARQVFDSMQKRDVVSWSNLLLGYGENGEGHVALDLFSRMKQECVPDPVACVAILKACASIGALSLGRKFHSEVVEFTAHVVTCLVDLYAKCGSMVEARAVFDLHSRARDISTWNALLAGYSTSGDTDSVFKLFEAMREDGFLPDAVTFLCMLLCCSHAGLVEKAREYWKAMPRHGATPTVRHYTCMVDTLGRANQVHEAIAVLHGMPCSPDAVIWMTLLGACRRWKNVEIGRLAFKSAMDIDKTNASAYVLMGHIYGSRGMWVEQEKVLGNLADGFSEIKEELDQQQQQQQYSSISRNS